MSLVHMSSHYSQWRYWLNSAAHTYTWSYI